MSSQEKRRLLHAILKFLQNDTSVDQESIAVACQVISDAYQINSEDTTLQLPSSVDLLSVFEAGLQKLNVNFEEENIEKGNV